MKLSIIIPVLNEENNIQALIQSLQVFTEVKEIIFVDGGSEDSTRAIIDKSGLVCVQSEKGRAKQMNRGASLATGEVFLFLHADTFLPSDISELLNITHIEKLWGRFDLKLTANKKTYRLIELMINLRSRFTGVATGDQAVFVSKALFESVKGYEEIPLMEDIALSKTLRKISQPVCLKSKVITSSRRWEERGVIKTILLMWCLRFLYFMGVHPNKIARLYG